ncbi:MAG: hypothetical protein R6X02_17245 [Enhygromyxa sp.]
MILTAAMRALATERSALGPTDPTLLARACEFQNTPYRLSRTPLLVDADQVQATQSEVEAYVEVINRLLVTYLDSAATRAWFGLPSAVEDLILAGGPVHATARVCRLDGYLEAARPGDPPQLRILEHNADAPAGTLFTPRLNDFVARTWGACAEPYLPMERSEAPFLDLLIASAEREDPRIVILQPADKSHRESQEIVSALVARGVDARLADPRELEASAHGFVLDGELVDVLWNKINTVYWNALIDERPELVSAWCRALETGASVHLNGFAARYVAEAKTALAYLQLPAFQAELEPAARELVSRLLPRTRLLDEGTLDQALGQREELVLKQRYDVRGDGVTVGRAVDDELWRVRMRATVNQGVIQAYVEPTRAPVLFDGEREAIELRHSLDWFVFDGRVVGLGSKASHEFRVNLFQGGTKLAVAQLRSA